MVNVSTALDIVSLCIKSQKLKLLDDVKVIVTNVAVALVYVGTESCFIEDSTQPNRHSLQSAIGDKQGVLSDKEIVHPITETKLCLTNYQNVLEESSPLDEMGFEWK